MLFGLVTQENYQQLLLCGDSPRELLLSSFDVGGGQDDLSLDSVHGGEVFVSFRFQFFDVDLGSLELLPHLLNTGHDAFVFGHPLFD